MAFAVTPPPQDHAQLRALIAVHERRLGGSFGTAPLGAVVEEVAAEVVTDPALDATLVAWAL